MKKILFLLLLFVVTVNNKISAQELPNFTKTVLDSETHADHLVFNDFNKDGKNDILFFNSSGYIGVFLSENGGYKKTLIDKDIYSYQVNINDFNGDGNNDILINDKIYLGDGKGQFPNNISLNLNNIDAYSLCSGDFNNDKKTDIVVGKKNSEEIIIYENLNNTWVEKNVINTSAYSISSVNSADLNYDGNLDLIISYEYLIGKYADTGKSGKQTSVSAPFFTHRVDILYGNGNGDFLERKNIVEYYFGVTNFDVSITDYNKDSILDLICINSACIKVFKNNGTGDFNLEWELERDLLKWICLPTDLNGDKLTDIVLIGGYEPYISQYSAFFGIKNGTFSEEKFGNIDINSEVSKLITGDLNNDGYDDIIASTSEGIITFINSNHTFVETKESDNPDKIIDVFPANPNPFNLTTSISFKLYKQCKIDIIIYNILGQKIYTVESKEFAPGVHKISINEILNLKVAGGIYICLFKINNLPVKSINILYLP